MDLKSPQIFSILILFLIPLQAFALTDNDVMTRYPNQLALQTAIDNGEVNYCELPTDFHNFTKNTKGVSCTPTYDPNQSSTTYLPNNSNKQTEPNFYSVIALMISFILWYPLSKHKDDRLTTYGILFFIISLVLLFVIWITTFLDTNGKIGASIMVCAIGWGIGIAFVIRGRQAYVIHTDSEQHTTKETGVFPKGFGINKPIHQRKTDHSLIHQILLSIGIIKVKENA